MFVGLRYALLLLRGYFEVLLFRERPRKCQVSVRLHYTHFHTRNAYKPAVCSAASVLTGRKLSPHVSSKVRVLTGDGHYYVLLGALAVSCLGGRALYLSCHILRCCHGSLRGRGQNHFLLSDRGRGLRSYDRGRLCRSGSRRALDVGEELGRGGGCGFLLGRRGRRDVAPLRLGGRKLLGGVA